jgi:chitin disaccharide deacetylase
VSSSLTSEPVTPELGNVMPGANVILCADDFAITPGVTRGIRDLARARRLSATSAIVTMPGWETDAAVLRDLRGYLAAGLHLNLTLGAPLSAMPRLAPDGEFPDSVHIVRKSLSLTLDLAEVKNEIAQQLERFITGTGFPPDFIDGHQHVHALPGIRTALLDVLVRRFPNIKPLIRDPADTWTAIAKRKTSVIKAAGLSILAHGFGKRARILGFPVNHGFAGFSAFDMKRPYAGELDCFFAMRGPRHLVMCHPGYVDETLADLDIVVERRRQELDALFAAPHLDSAIWHVRRRADGPPVDWREALPV